MFDFPLHVAALDDVPECYRGLYQPGEEAAAPFALDPQLAEKLDVSGLVSALEKERGAAQGFEKELKAWRSLGPDPDTARTAISSALSTAFEERLALKDAEIAALAAENGAFLIETRATEAILKAGGSVELLMPHIRAAVRLEAAAVGGRPAIRILGADGAVRSDADGAPLTLEALVSEMRNSPVFARAFAPTGHRGSGMDPGGLIPGRGVVSGHHPGALNARIEDIARGRVTVAL